MNFSSESYTHNTGGGINKILTPGEHYCRIVDLELATPPWSDDSLFLKVKLEGPHMGNDFEGIAIDKNNPSLGNYKGQVAIVDSFRYAFKTYEYQGKAIDRDQQIFNWINALATQLGIFEDIQKKGIKANTIQDYVTAVKPFLMNPELWGTFVLAGREYYKDGYDKPNYNLFFPKKSGKNFPYSALIDANKEPKLNLLKFDEKEHIIKDETNKPSAPSDVDSFGKPDNDIHL